MKGLSLLSVIGAIIFNAVGCPPDGGVKPMDTGDTGSYVETIDADEDGYVESEDCDDHDASINPDATEICDEIDNDCDGNVDEDDATDAATWYADTDDDGYGDASDSSVACEQPSGYVADDSDCDDADDVVYPGAAEFCDEIDNDCDGSVDEGVIQTLYHDADGDGYGDPAVSTEGCEESSEYVFNDSDCNDSDASINPDATEICDEIDNDCDGVVDDETPTWYVDTDGDGYGDASDSSVACEQPSGYVSDATDCDDSDASTNPDATEICDGFDNDCDGTVDEDDASDAANWYVDTDGDGYGDATTLRVACYELSGYVADATDCDDADASINPGAEEFCDEIDNDCDGDVDEDDATDAATWYADTDGDGYGDAESATDTCEQPSGYVSDDSDCDDSDATVSPDGEEVCDGIDNDCDGDTDEDDATDAATWYADTDGDGFGDVSNNSVACEQPSGYVSDATDCDDNESSAYPGASEYCDGIDNDCDGTVDEDEALDASIWYADTDGDAYGDPSGSTLTQCEQPSGYSSDATDCDDSDATVNPGEDEVCNSVDDDCDGDIDDDATDATMFYADTDGDGYGDTSNTTLSCSSKPSGYVSDATDCDDSDASTNPDATEICDGIDNDCDGSIDEGSKVTDWYVDTDSDGYGNSSDTIEACAQPSGYVSDDSDCDDSDATVSPDGEEVCDGIDNDCDGDTDEDGAADGYWLYLDADGDGYGDDSELVITCTSEDYSGYVDEGDDCDDSDADVNPDAVEYDFVLDPESDDYLTEVGSCSDGIDQDCNGDIDTDDWACEDEDSDGFVNAVDPYIAYDSDGDGLEEVCGVAENLYEPAWAGVDVYAQEYGGYNTFDPANLESLVTITMGGEDVGAWCVAPDMVGYDYGAFVSAIGADGTSAVDTSNCGDWVRPLEEVCDTFADPLCEDITSGDGCAPVGNAGFLYYFDGTYVTY